LAGVDFVYFPTIFTAIGLKLEEIWDQVLTSIKK